MLETSYKVITRLGALHQISAYHGGRWVSTEDLRLSSVEISNAIVGTSGYGRISLL